MEGGRQSSYKSIADLLNKQKHEKFHIITINEAFIFSFVAVNVTTEMPFANHV